MATVTVKLYPYKMPSAVLKNVQAGATGNGVSQVSKSAADKILDFFKKTLPGGGSGGGGSGGGSGGKSGSSGSGSGSEPNYTAGQLVTQDETVYMDQQGNIVDQNGAIVLPQNEVTYNDNGDVVDSDGNVLVPLDQISSQYYEDYSGESSYADDYNDGDTP